MAKKLDGMGVLTEKAKLTLGQSCDSLSGQSYSGDKRLLVANKGRDY